MPRKKTDPFAEGYTELVINGLLVKAPEEAPQAAAESKEEGEGRG